jgi:hypothetical protein
MAVRKRDRADFMGVHRHCTSNREALEQSQFAGCFYCLAVFDPKEIMDWVDGPFVDTGDTSDGITALCPRCGIDAVLPSNAPFVLDNELLSAMHTYFF